MLAAIPEHEMAETLSVLAGTNASNAARHFGKQSYEKGDIAGAVLWSSIAQALERMAAQEPAESVAMQPLPRRMTDTLEAAAFEGVWYEDVDADVLIRETLQQTLEAITEAAGGNAEAAADSRETADRPPKLELVSAQVPQPPAGASPESRHIWSRIAKRGSTRMAA